MAQRCTRAWRQLEVKNGNKSTTTSGHDYAGKRGDHCYFVQFFDGLSKLRAPRVCAARTPGLLYLALGRKFQIWHLSLRLDQTALIHSLFARAATKSQFRLRCLAVPQSELTAI